VLTFNNVLDLFVNSFKLSQLLQHTLLKKVSLLLTRVTQ